MPALMQILLSRHGGHYIHKDEPTRVMEGISWFMSVVQNDIQDAVDVVSREGSHTHRRLTPVRGTR
ncbi:MAG: hypothetical protein ABW127_12760 [Candidatus Thiodiazotropha endolucinida]